MEKFVYVIIENGSWDYEMTNGCSVFESFQKELAKYKELVKETKQDMENWADEEDLSIEEMVDTKEKNASFSMYENGNYVKLHSDIFIYKKEVI